MKKTTLLLFFISLTLFTFSQTKPYIKESLLYLTVENGVGVDVPVRFEFYGEKTLNVIKQKDYYLNSWLFYGISQARQEIKKCRQILFKPWTQKLMRSIHPTVFSLHTKTFFH